MFLQASTESIKTDVLVVGGGAAGIRAAIEAKERGVDVVLAVKGKFAQSGSSFFSLMDGWGLQAAVFPDDSPEEHFQEILQAASGMCAVKLARILAEEAPARLADLEGWGVKFRKKDGDFIRGKGCFSHKARAVTTENMENVRLVFQREVKKRGIKILEDTMITSLFSKDGMCWGGVGIREDQTIVSIRAKSTVLATGGGSGIFQNSLTASEVTCDGQMMALEAGAELFNMEFVQFIYAVLYPQRLIFRERAFKLHPRICNGNGDLYLKKHLPPGVEEREVLEERAEHGPFTSRLRSRYFDIATYKEITEDRASQNGGVYFDIRHLKVEEQSRYPMIDHWLRWLSRFGVDVSQTILEICPSAHALNGGIMVDEHAETSVEGLFAAGEVISGPHGADRLGGNMMSLTQVFGARAGKYSASRAQGRESVPWDESEIRAANEKMRQIALNSKEKNGGESAKLRDHLQKTMWENVAICRSEKNLSRALSELESLTTNRLPRAKGLPLSQRLSFRNALGISRVITEAALLRRESRGPHYREDFPNLNDGQFAKRIVVRKEGEQMVFSWQDSDC